MDSNIFQRLAEVTLDMAETLRPDTVTLKELARRMQLHERTVALKVKRGEVRLRPVEWSQYRMLFLRRDVDRLLGTTPAPRSGARAS